MRFSSLTTVVFIVAVCIADASSATEQKDQPDGYDLLVNRAYVPPDLNEEIFANIWRSWPEPLRSEAAEMSPAQRRKAAFSRYGLTTRPNDDSGKPLQYVVDQQGNWSMNCFACHGGKVAGQIVPGLPNSHINLQTLMDEVRETKKILGMPISLKELGSLFFPYAHTRGSTNAVMFGVFLGHYRDDDLNVIDAPYPKMTHHDMDAPPWWYLHRRQRLYIDGFAEKSHRALMPFMLTRNNDAEVFRQREDDFRVIFDYISSLRPPKYPYEVNAEVAARGRRVFEKNCSECHGTYGRDAAYPQVTISIDDIGTDRVRLDALPRSYREGYGRGWFADYGREDTIIDPDGYLAPPLDGIWASAPYFHNGSVPTLWHVLNPDERPTIWRRSEDGYDQQHVGIEVDVLDRLPRVTSRKHLREFFDTRRFGKSADGHDYPDVLSPAEKRDVLEYLKTL